MIQRGSLALVVFLSGCTCSTPPLIPRIDAAVPDAGIDGGQLEPDAAGPRDGGPPPDQGTLDPDAACASQTASAVVERLPVDIIWMIDNSVSMEPAIEQVQAGLNDFTALIGGRDLDYRVIMLSLRGRSAPSGRYAVCIPPPLSGDTECGDGPRFFHISMDVRSTLPIEQFLGSLAQTAGYTEEEAQGSAPWRDLLRDEATKTIVFVTDDNARTCERSNGATCQSGDPRLTATSLEDFPGGGNPFSSRVLGPGILTAEYGTLFEGYTFNALYGWGSETDIEERCVYPSGDRPVASGATYTELVTRTGGVRAQICDGPSAWGPFFDALATAVERTSRIDCTITIPEPPDGSFFERDRINVLVDTGEGATRLGKVSDAAACDERGGWHYDDEDAPSAVILCPASCEAVQAAPGETRRVDVQFGCQTIPI